MIAAVLFALACVGPEGGRENRLHLAELELVGPLERVRLSLGAMGETLVVGPLADGERRRLQVPLPAWGDPSGLAPDVELTGEGSASFLGWNAAFAAELEQRWLELPAGLRARPLAVPPETDRRRPPETVLLVVAALFVVGLALRRRPLLSHLFGLLGAAAVTVLVYPEAVPAAGIEVLEGHGESGRWVRVHGRRGSLALCLDAEMLRLEALPARAQLRFEATLAELDWSVAARGALLFQLDSRRPGALDSARNELFSLARVWVRGPARTGWAEHPPWALGSGIRASLRPADPPGWLNPALPLGQGILIGRAAKTSAGEPVWVRLVGFSPP